MLLWLFLLLLTDNLTGKPVKTTMWGSAENCFHYIASEVLIAISQLELFALDSESSACRDIPDRIVYLFPLDQ